MASPRWGASGGEKWEDKVRRCHIHLPEMCAYLLKTEKSLDLILHSMLTGGV
jgi:hypothetical protein